MQPPLFRYRVVARRMGRLAVAGYVFVDAHDWQAAVKRAEIVWQSVCGKFSFQAERVRRETQWSA